MKFEKRIGNRREVFSGIAKITGGGLRKNDLYMRHDGKIISKKLSKIMKKRNKLKKIKKIKKYKNKKISSDGGFIKSMSELFIDKSDDKHKDINYIGSSKSKDYYKNNILKGGSNIQTTTEIPITTETPKTPKTPKTPNTSNLSETSNVNNNEINDLIDRIEYEKKINGDIYLKIRKSNESQMKNEIEILMQIFKYFNLCDSLKDREINYDIDIIIGLNNSNIELITEFTSSNIKEDYINNFIKKINNIKNS